MKEIDALFQNEFDSLLIKDNQYQSYHYFIKHIDQNEMLVLQTELQPGFVNSIDLGLDLIQTSYQFDSRILATNKDNSLVELVQREIQSKKPKFILIASLNNLVLHPAFNLNFLSFLFNCGAKVVVVLHADCQLGLEYQNILHDYCQIHLKLVTYKNTVEYYQGLVVDFIIKKSNGKTANGKLGYSITGSEELQIYAVPSRPIPKLNIKKSPLENDLSFNLNLSESEKRAKDGLALPYMAAQTTSIIHYTPDEGDDYDEQDDVDDDLDI
jgi:hypothetical protein